MSVRTWFDSLTTGHSRPQNRRPKTTADRRLAARRLLMEGLEDRRLMAFNVLAEYATGLNPTNVALAQIDAGGQLDLVLANSSASQGSVRLGNAGGTFDGPQSTGVTTFSVATGDVTGDGITDLVSTNADVILQAGNGDGTFQPPQTLTLPPQTMPGNPDPAPVPQYPLSVATGDLNADGKLDLVVAGVASFSVYKSYYQCGYYSCGYIGFWQTYTDGFANVLLGNGSGGFASPEVYPLGRGNSPAAIAIGDLDGDGNEDVITANTYNLSALLGDGTGDLEAAVNSGSGYPLKSISLGDLDGDGNLDTITNFSNSLTVQKGQGDGTFVPSNTVNMGLPVSSAVMGDVNGDGKLDLVAAGSQFTCTSSGYYGCYDGDYSGQSSVVLGNGLGSFSLPIASPLGTDFSAAFVDVALADLTGDGLPEVVTIEANTGLAIVAINDGDWFAPVALSISSPSVLEGHAGTVDLIFIVTLASPSQRDVTVDYATAPDEQYWYGSPPATAGVDYTATAGTLTIPAGETSGTITVPVSGDRVGEWDEVLFVNLSNPTFANIENPRAVGAIIDDEPYVSMEYYITPEVTEGNTGTTPMTFTVVLSAASDIPVTVSFSTVDGSALAGSDYQATTGMVTFAAGETTRTLTVQVIGDTQAEDDEYFYVNLSAPTNAKVGTNYKIGYIHDNDRPPTIAISDASVVEGNSGTKLLTFTVNLSNASGQGVWVNYQTKNGTATTSNNDYVAKTGTIYFAPGETSKSITVTIKGDTKKEKDERFYVNLSGASGGTISDSQGLGTILNDDGVTRGNAKPSNRNLSASAVDAAIYDWMFAALKKRGR